MPKWTLLVMMPLAACAPGASERISMTQTGAAACDDRALASFVGQAPTKETALKLMGFSRSQNLRWVPFGGAMTMDHDPKRLTVQLDSEGKIASARCG
ncbi:MAG TPA: I78 family peptidase inhibitor [Sphingomicrobium sp.]|nr:I78 family peptidase inhibitor [Sphingomicrobium sp.]